MKLPRPGIAREPWRRDEGSATRRGGRPHGWSFAEKFLPLSDALLVLFLGQRRDLGSNRSLYTLPIFCSDPIAKPIEPLLHVIPEEHALCGNLYGTVGDAAQIGDMPLGRPALDAHPLNEDGGPMLVLFRCARARVRPVIAASNLLARTSKGGMPPFPRLPSNEHGRSA